MDAPAADAVQYRAIGEIHAREKRQLKGNNDHSQFLNGFSRPGTWIVPKL